MKLSRLIGRSVVVVLVGISGVSRAQNCFNSSPASCSPSPTCGAPAPTTESDVGFSRTVAGTLTNAILGLAGCGQAICTTNRTAVISAVCQPNLHPSLFGYQPAGWLGGNCQGSSASQPVTVTNYITTVTCTNNYGNTATFRLSQSLSGLIAANATCDELAGYLPPAATFAAQFVTSVREPDWRGYHTGTFTIHDGTNVFATGSLAGDNGVDAHGAVEPCASCGHFEGLLTGTLTKSSGLPGSRIQATYAGDIAGPAGCASNQPPQGPVTLFLDGVVITTNCIVRSIPTAPTAPAPPTTTTNTDTTIGSTGPCGTCLVSYLLDFDWSAVVSDQGGGCVAPGTSTGHCSLPVTHSAGCIWTSAQNPASGVAGGVQYITGAEIYPDIDMGDGTYYFGVTIGTYCIMIPNTDTVNPSACPTGAYQDAQTSGCSDSTCVYSFSISNITVH